MADPLSIGASVLAFIGLADRIIRACKYCIEAVEDAPKDIQMILGEVTSLRAVMDGIGDSSASSLVPNLYGENGPIRSCKGCLSSLESLLPTNIGQPTAGKRRKVILVELSWPLKQSKVRKLLAEISHHKATLLLAMSGDMSRDLKEIRLGIERLQSTISEDILETVLTRLEVLYVVIDAVDESTARENLLAMIETLALDQRFQNLRILATSRQYFDIEQSFSKISTSISMSNPMVDADIRKFVYSRLRSSHRLKRWNARFEEIENVLSAMAQGMFRWAECQIQAIERLRDQSKLQQLLSNLPRGLSETYTRIFEAIPEEDRPLIRRILVWIIGHSQSPWIYHVGVNAKLLLSAVTYEYLGCEANNQNSIIDLEYFQEICSCLITVRHVPGDIFDTLLEESPGSQAKVGTDGEDLYVSLTHYTVLEFLLSPHVSQTNFAFFAMSSELIRLEFARTVFKQALAADPKGTSTDWIHDREAYCLTLGCALYICNTNESPSVAASVYPKWDDAND
ncbi:ankyrin repeat [Fusarium beomiforme]|uniref:Ankyrin repeat n=1 Tax=Fusarium beomiforme TaxID=44412 RepID=A0A9P5AJ46_9HYPO|nr:ankyrin repeat [Fusarium beomiforme]